MQGHNGAKISEIERDSERFVIAELDLNVIDNHGAFWRLFRDRGPDLYGAIITLDGETKFK